MIKRLQEVSGKYIEKSSVRTGSLMPIRIPMTFMT